MRTPDITPLFKGVLVLIMLAIGFGQYPKLERWARVQALEAMQWKQGLPYFFASPSSSKRSKRSTDIPRSPKVREMKLRSQTHQ